MAALCGVSPIEYSSGRRSTRWLDHGSDRFPSDRSGGGPA
ncbi:hypothetical protein ACIRG6_15955 [Streptomyces flaveolus]